MKCAEDELESLVDLLKDNYLLSSVVIIATEKIEGSVRIIGSRRGNSYEVVGMLEDTKYRIINEGD